MKVPVSWLRDLVNLGGEVTTLDLAHRLTSAGLTVERITRIGSPCSGPLVIGQVLSSTAEQQKNGKVIHYCRVDVGPEHNDEPTAEFPASRGIVCGAHNFKVGDLVVVSLPGATLPNGFEISSRKTYGHLSDGMICASDEIGLDTDPDPDGVMIIPADSGLKPGDDALSSLWSVDEVLEMEITPDLSYALSLRGIARDAAQLCETSYVDAYLRPVPEVKVDGYPVEFADSRCPLFIALGIEDFNPSTPTPMWMARRLEAAGMRSISLAVDITNYVMLESGQPLHAYDREKLNGTIVVRAAQPGEHLVTLDGVRRELQSTDLLIADESGPIGLAGVMGGSSTEVSASTTSIVLEAAHFDPATVSQTMRRLNLPSEASRRFERGVDPALPYAAARRAAELMAELGGGRVLAAETVVGEVAHPPGLNFRATLPSQVLGAELSAAEVIATLQASGVQVTALGDSLTLTPPTWRNDLREPYDYVEEIGSKLGYDRIGSRVPCAPPGRGYTPRQLGGREVLRAVSQLGFTEILSLPFIGEPDLNRMGIEPNDPRRSTVQLANPLSDTNPFLRTSLLPGLFAAVVRNTSRSLNDLALFEQGISYYHRTDDPAPRPGVTQRPTDEELLAIDESLPTQVHTMAAVVTGNWLPQTWDGSAVPATWRHVVAFAETAASALGMSLHRRSVELAPWHPGRCAELLIGDQVIGHAGELHPTVCENFGLPDRTCAVEFSLDALIDGAPQGGRISVLSPFPLAKEDVALIVDESVTVADVEAALVEGAGELLESIALFDIYRGTQIGEGKKSLAFALRFRGETTLTDEQAGAARQAAVVMAESRLGAVQRAS